MCTDSDIQIFLLYASFSGGPSDKEPACHCRRCKRLSFDLWVGKSPWRRAWQPTPIFLPAESHGQRNRQATVHRVAESQTQFSTHSACIFILVVKVQGPATCPLPYWVWLGFGNVLACPRTLTPKILLMWQAHRYRFFGFTFLKNHFVISEVSESFLSPLLSQFWYLYIIYYRPSFRVPS